MLRQSFVTPFQRLHHFSNPKRTITTFERSLITHNSSTYSSPTGRYTSQKPLVAICLDGSSLDYFEIASKRGAMPHLNTILKRRVRETIKRVTPGSAEKYVDFYETLDLTDQLLNRSEAGVLGIASASMPTFTNVNNCSIATLSKPSEHGISGNTFYDKMEDKSMNDPKFLRNEMIFSSIQKYDPLAYITIITCKNKLLKLLSHNLILNEHVSAMALEDLSTSQYQTNPFVTDCLKHLLAGQNAPSVYSGEISILALKIAIEMIKRRQMHDPALPINENPAPHIYYISTTDYVQHKFAPEEAVDFYGKIDECIGQLHSLNCFIGLTADHGMNYKSQIDGTVNCVYLSEVLIDVCKLKPEQFHIVLPITDAYIKHHSSLGSFAMIYLKHVDTLNQFERDQFTLYIMSQLRKIEGIYTVLNRTEAAKSLDLPADRIGDICIVSTTDFVLGKFKSDHSLNGLAGRRLRSHGSFFEQTVPIFFNKPIKSYYKNKLHRGSLLNLDLFRILLDGERIDD